MHIRPGTLLVATVITLAGGWTPARAVMLPSLLAPAGASIPSGLSAIPLQPKPFSVPAQPIVPASSDGYLPSSWEVTPKGELTWRLPIAVPPGRAGMAPALALSYASGAGNGIAGVGWSIEGFSTITRGGRVWARDGATDGVSFGPRDRFYLDGQELVSVNRAPYGGNGAEYRTETDTFVRVRSQSAAELDPKGPQQFTVELGDGRVRTYAPVEAEQVTFDNDNKVFAHGTVRVEWRLASEADASGNTITYEYDDTAGPGGASASDYWIESVPSKIFYTANLVNGLPTHGLQDLPQRYVAFEYESRPDATAGWSAGVQRRHSRRLKTIRLYAPNPNATAEVWRYTLAYTVGGSARSLLSSVERCEAAGGCLWAKEFTYSPSTSDVSFQTQPIVPEPIPAKSYDFTLAAAPEGEVPAMQLPDLNGDGARDLLFGAGSMMLWEEIHYGPPYDHVLPTGKFLGGSHDLWLSGRDANGAIVPFADGRSIARDEDPLATANYGHVRLDEAEAADVDGDGRDELVAAIDNIGAHELNVDPNLPPLLLCSFATLEWTDAGFVHRDATPCTELGVTDKGFRFYLPNEFPTFADFDGDGLPDRAQLFNTDTWGASGGPNGLPKFAYAPAWQVALNTPTQAGLFAAPKQFPQAAASPGVVTDLRGEGRAELTNEALKSSWHFDADGQWTKTAPDSVHMPADAFGPVDGYREFGDYNGDGTEDVLRLARTDPTRPQSLTAQIFWNTDRGFYPDNHVRTIDVDVHPDFAQQQKPTRLADPGIHVTDLNGDGRMDVVVFHNDHTDNGNPAPEIELLLSNGDGTFTEKDLPVTAGTRDDVKYWLDETLRPIQFYPNRLENDLMRVEIDAFADKIPGAGFVLALLPQQKYIVNGSNADTPGIAAGWNLATLADMNADGFVDIVRHVGGNDPAGGFEVMQQTPQWGDELTDVTDAATKWPALSIEYSGTWSDRPETDDSYVCAYPLKCVRSGLRVVRAVTTRTGLTDLKAGDDPLGLGHRHEYAYRDPVANVQGLGFFGFSEMRAWDAAPEHPVETITTFDLRTPDASGTRYPGVGVPATVTVAQPILAPGQGQPASAVARITKSHFAYELRELNDGATHAVFPATIATSTWEQPVAIAWSDQGPDRRHVSGYSEPPDPPIHVATTLTIDDYGNTIDRVTQTAKGLETEVETPALNDTVDWHLGLVSERSVMTLETAKGAVPAWQTTGYTWTARGQLETITTEPASANPALKSTTTIEYDDYGLVVSATSTAPGEAPRVSRLDYATAWPGAIDEHLFASTAWSDHDAPLCPGDCRPATWLLTHPAYGLTIAAMDNGGVQATRSYDAHGRPVLASRDGELPTSVTYAGRADAFGGLNGLQATATTGLQQVMKTFDARGAGLRASFTGFDGQWVNTFATYDALGRRTGRSRPGNGAPVAWTRYAYDSLGRTVTTTYPDGSHADATYGLFNVASTDPAGHVSERDFDVDGRLIASVTHVPPPPGCGLCLAADVTSTYQYSATNLGVVTTVFDDQGNATKTQYDRRARPIHEDDPSAGSTVVAYNGFGDAKQTTHVATGDIETRTYDDLGRLMTSTTPDGLTTLTWDAATHGIGKLASATSPDQITTAYRYDALGRTAGIDQTDEAQQTASLDFAYDVQTGQLAHIDYPVAPGQAARLRAAYAYNGYGYLARVSDATPNGSGTIWQQVTGRNADLALVDAVRGIDAGVGGGAIQDHRDYDPLMGRLWAIHARHEGADRLGVTYGYDADGLVNERVTTDEAVQIDETFDHDALHRLTHSTRDGAPIAGGVPFSSSTDETYDTLGNRIDTLRNGQLVEHRSYGGNNQSPYALTERDIADPANPNAPEVRKYQYDLLGRMKQDPHRSIAWTAFDLPSSVTIDGLTSTFRYDAHHARAKKSSAAETITYLGGVYEKHVSPQAVRHVYRIAGADGTAAEVTYAEAAEPTSPGTTSIVYPLVDALDTTYAVADALGTVAEHDYYDSWGRRSQPDGTPIDTPLFQSLFAAGFTSQEHDDALGLINMRGRLYDPALGRFLSADPIVGAPAFGQSWNAYSYVLDNPIDFVDPSGFDCAGATTVEDGGKTVTTVTGCHDDAIGAADGAGLDAVRMTSGIPAMIHDLAAIAQQRQAIERQRELARASANPHDRSAADGTPLSASTTKPSGVRGWIADTARAIQQRQAREEDWALKKIGAFAVKLFCGTQCASASAPTNEKEAVRAPKQLTDAQIARNALSQAVAARSAGKKIGKAGLLIDEGVEGVIDRLAPPGMGVDDDEEEESKKVARWLAERRALRATERSLAEQSYKAAQALYLAAASRRDRLHDNFLASERELAETDPSDVSFDLLTQTYLDNKSEYERADSNAALENYRAQSAWDWWQHLQGDDE